MKKWVLISGFLLLSSPIFASICVTCCESWLASAEELLNAGGYTEYVENVLIPHIEANCF